MCSSDLISLSASSALAANLVVNGSFETDNFNLAGGYRLGLINNDVTGWFIPAGDGVYPWGIHNSSGYGPADTGNQFFVLGEERTGASYTIRQTLTGLTAGSTYAINWAAASELNCCSPGELSFLSGSSTGAYLFAAPNSGAYWTNWGHYATTFVANSSSVTFQFKNVNPNGNGYDLGLDSVFVDLVAGGGVPEPATWAMMILGFGIVGTALRGNRRRVQA